MVNCSGRNSFYSRNKIDQMVQIRREKNVSLPKTTSMKNISTTLFTLLFLFGFSSISQAQDPHFTQFYNNPLYLNPATAGAHECGGNAYINRRNQWPSLPSRFITTQLSGEHYLKEVHGALGMNFQFDVAADLKTTSMGVLYSYVKSLSNDVELHLGIEPQVIQKKYDRDLRFADQLFDTTFMPGSNIVNIFNLNTGVYLLGDRFDLGFALHNATEPQQSFFGNSSSRLPRRISVHGSYKIKLGTIMEKEHSIQPTALFMLQNKFTQLNATLRYNAGPVFAGAGFRQTFGEFTNMDALLLMLGAKVKKMQFAYSYDMTVSDFRSAAPGSHEFSVRYRWCDE